MKVNSIVKLNKRLEVTPLNFVDENAMGIVVDITVPNYARVKFQGDYYGAYWIDMKHLDLVAE